jgi:hypothetical protein
MEVQKGYSESIRLGGRLEEAGSMSSRRWDLFCASIISRCRVLCNYSSPPTNIQDVLC